MDQQEFDLKILQYCRQSITGNGNLEPHSRHQPCSTGYKEAGKVTYIPPYLVVRDLHKKSEKQCLEEGGTS